jgi:hypothetical protein
MIKIERISKFQNKAKLSLKGSFFDNGVIRKLRLSPNKMALNVIKLIFEKS